MFERVLEIRRINEGVDHKKANAITEYINERSSTEPNRLQGLDDYERWNKAFNAKQLFDIIVFSGNFVLPFHLLQNIKRDGLNWKEYGCILTSFSII